MTLDEAERALRDWAENQQKRNTVVLAAYEAGVSISGICAITGIARSTIYAILGTRHRRHG